jgi:hypothetical protein
MRRNLACAGEQLARPRRKSRSGCIARGKLVTARRRAWAPTNRALCMAHGSHWLGAMNGVSTLSVFLLVSAIFTGSMLHAHAARPAIDASAETSAQGDDAAAHESYWQSWAAATAQ